MLFEAAGLIIGLVVLVKASEGAINSSIVTSKLLGLSEMFVGLVVLAFATSLPELAVNILSAINGNSIIGFSNLIGANVANIAVLFGILGIITTFKIPAKELEGILEIFLLTGIIALFILVFGFVGKVFGLFLLCMFYLFMNRLFKEGFRANGNARKNGIPTLVALKNIGKILGFIALVIIAAHVVVSSALSMSSSFGIMQSFIGATIISLGTTLPEISVSVAAIRKKNVSLAIGNAVGSLVANLTLILGVSALLSSSIVLDAGAKIAVLFMLLAYAVFYVVIHDKVFTPVKSVILFGVYILFLISMIVVGVL
ncbi:MAG: sodium:calcium antiporter [Candidatus Aenigmarchaeota archaeon]|nr:sodium:calcium antiporter [Candidatus Aenigmarchaeota archaeon]